MRMTLVNKVTRVNGVDLNRGKCPSVADLVTSITLVTVLTPRRGGAQ